MPAFRTLDDAKLSGKRVLCRVDLNVPIADGKVTDATRIERVVPTLREIMDKGGALIVLAHFDRPKGKVVPEMSLKPVASALEKLLGRPVRFVFTDWREAPQDRRETRRMRADGEHALSPGRGEERRGLLEAACGAWRHLRERRLLGGASRALLDRGRGPLHSGLCGPRHGGGTQGAAGGARNAEAPGHRHRRRRQGLDQARPAGQSGEEGRCAGDRRGHGQHLPAGAGPRRSASRWPRPTCSTRRGRSCAPRKPPNAP